MNHKSTLIKSIQNIAGVDGVNLLAISPESPDFMVVEIYFDPETVIDRLTPEEVALRNYNATVKRGLITDLTKVFDFCGKINEELNELTESVDYIPKNGTYEVTFDEKELADISLVCDAMAIHYGIDLQAEKEAKMRYNEQRKD